MATVPESTNQGNPSDGNLGPFPSFRNIGAPYMATLSLPRFNIGLRVWLFLTPMVPNVQTSYQRGSPPHELYQSPVDPNVDAFPSSLVWSSSSYYSSSGESPQVGN